jgi:hypothetical protein
MVKMNGMFITEVKELMNCWLYNKDLSPIWLDTDNMLVKLYAGFY